MKKTPFQNFNISVVIALALTILSYGVGLAFGWLEFTTLANLPWFEILAVLTAYSSTYLCVVQSRWNYPIGAISTALFIIVFYKANLFASMALNFYLTFTLIYGWFRWRPDADTRPVTSILDSKWYVLAGYAFLALAAYGLAYNTSILAVSQFGPTAALLAADIAIFIFTVVAQIMLDNKKLENWLVWIIVNVFCIYVYSMVATPPLYLLTFQYVLFLINTLYGFYKWKKGIKVENRYPIIRPV